MCKAPRMLQDGTLVACRECSLCRERAISDWVGRCVAESKTASLTLAGTLTYGRNSAHDVLHERAVILTYSDFQKFIKLLRRHGYNVRYLVAGEYGSKKGRAHWHPVLFFYGKVPDWKLDRNIEIPEWPHGYSYWTKPSHHALRYNIKYIRKEMDQKQGHLAMSKKPPLGDQYFRELAGRYVQQGLAPQDLFYTFPEVQRRKKDGTFEVVPFMMRGKTAENFLSQYIEQWQAKHGNRPWPNSQLVDLFSEWGRVINDEDHATQNADWYQSFKTGAGSKARSVWAALAQHFEFWEGYWQRWPDGEERQKQRERDEVQYFREWCVAYDECVKAGAKPSDAQREFRHEIGIALANIVCGGDPYGGRGDEPGAVTALGRQHGWHWWWEDEFPGWDFEADQPRRKAG